MHGPGLPKMVHFKQIFAAAHRLCVQVHMAGYKPAIRVYTWICVAYAVCVRGPAMRPSAATNHGYTNTIASTGQ